MDISTISAISSITAAIGVIAGVIYYMYQVRHQAGIRQTDLVMKLYSAYGGREFQEAWVETLRLDFKDFNDYLKKYGATSGKPAYVSVNMVASFFEGIGILLHKRLIDIALVDDLFSSDIIITWHKMQLIVAGWRKQFNRPQISEWFEYLYNEMRKREQQLAKT